MTKIIHLLCRDAVWKETSTGSFEILVIRSQDTGNEPNRGMLKNATQVDSLGEWFSKRLGEPGGDSTRGPASDQEASVFVPLLSGLNLRERHTSELCSKGKPNFHPSWTPLFLLTTCI